MNISPQVTRASGAKSKTRLSALRILWGNGRARWGLTILAVMVLVAVFAPVLSPYSPSSTNFAPSLPPSWHHLLGTTLQGQDIFSQLISGTRNSLGVGLAVGVIATALSLVIGVLPTMGSPGVNAVFSTFTNIVLILPEFTMDRATPTIAIANPGGTNHHHIPRAMADPLCAQ